MAKTEGYSQFVCDRCGKTLYATKDAPEAQSWRAVSRVTADGVSISRLLCPDCSGRYRELAQAQDVAFGDLMANGTTTTVA